MSSRRVKNYKLFGSYSWYVPGWGGMFALLGWFFVGALLGMALTVPLAMFIPTEYCLLVSYPVQFIPPMLYASAKSRSKAMFDDGVALDSAHFGKSGVLLLSLALIAMTLSLAFVSDIISYGTFLLTEKSAILSEFYDRIMQAMKSVTNGPVWVAVLSTAVMAPFFEEWLCRGMVLRGLLQKTSPAAAIATSALFFAVLHMNPWQAIPAFILGCFFGYVYYKTGNIFLTMLMHAVNNLTAVIVSGIPSLSDYDYFIEFIPGGLYWALFALGVVVIAGVTLLVKEIPLEGRSNCDIVKS